MSYLPYLLISVGLNLLVFLPAYYLRTDKLTDLTYSLTFMLLAGIGFVEHGEDLPKTLLTFMIYAWAIRLGMYLFARIQVTGKDARFDEMHNKFLNYAGFWLLQGVAVFIISLPMLLFMHRPAVALDGWSFLGMGVFLFGLVFESVADYQKYKFKSRPENKARWMASGLWRKIRHPNYLGEISVWTGIWIFSLPALTFTQGLIAALSPAFIFVLLRFISGIPLLEQSAEKKWGRLPEYQAYKKQSGRLLPW